MFEFIHYYYEIVNAYISKRYDQMLNNAIFISKKVKKKIIITFILHPVWAQKAKNEYKCYKYNLGVRESL